MSPFITFILANLPAIESLIAELCKIFPAKTGAGQVSTALTTHPDAITALNQVVSDYSNLNK
jgi:hypothetical protein